MATERLRQTAHPSSLRFGPFVFDTGRHTLHRDGERVHLTSTQIETLAVLVANPLRLVGKQELLDAVWRDAAVTEDNLVQAIGEIRRVLGEKKGDDRFIQTVHCRGYRFVAPVEAVIASSDAAASPRPARTSSPHDGARASPAMPAIERGDAESWIPVAAVGMVLAGLGLTLRFITGERSDGRRVHQLSQGRQRRVGGTAQGPPRDAFRRQPDQAGCR